MSKKSIPENQIAFYQTSDGSINIEVMYANENVWLSQKRMSELFDVDRSVVTKHLKNIFSANELLENSVCANFAHTAEESSVVQKKGSRKVKFAITYYSLEIIIEGKVSQ